MSYTLVVPATSSPESYPVEEWLLLGPVPIAPPATVVTGTAAASFGFTGTVLVQLPFLTTIAGTGTTSYIADQFGQPIMLRAISMWMLFSHAGRWSGTAESTIDDAIADLEAIGANAIMVKTFSHTTFGSEDDTGNTHDDITPFVGGDIGVLNDTFWDRFDYLLNAAAAAGITVLVNMAHATSDLASGGILDGESAANMGDYGTALGARYKDFPNIIWMVGGDYFDEHETVLDALFAGIQGEGDTHLVSVQNFAETTSRKTLDTNVTQNTGTGLADFNFVYSYNVSYDGVNHAFAESSPIPAMWMDGFYDQNNAGSRKLLRDQHWWCFTSGGRGAMYGSEGLWQWGSGAGAALGAETFPTSDVGGIWDTFNAFVGWHQLVPDTDNSFLTAGRGTHAASYVSGGGGDQYTPADAQDGYVTAAVTPDGTLAVVYFPVDTTVTVDDTELVASYKVYWVDPVTGAATETSIASTYSPTGTNSLGGADRVLLFVEFEGELGTATGSFGFTGTVSGKPTTFGTAAGSFGFTGTALGKPFVSGTAAGSFGFTGTVAGVPRTFGSAAGLFGFTGTVSGLPRKVGQAVGTFGFTGTASGTTAGTVPGTAAGLFGFTGTVAGLRRGLGTAVATFGFTGTALGQPFVSGTAAGSFGFTGTVAGKPTTFGTALGSFGFTGAAAGTTAGEVTGTAVGTFGFTGTVSGFPRPLGALVGSFGFTGTVTGLDRKRGTALGTFGFTGTALGVISAATGTAQATFTFTGTVSGRPKHYGTAVGTFGPTLTVSGRLKTAGQAVAAFGPSLTALGVIVPQFTFGYGTVGEIILVASGAASGPVPVATGESGAVETGSGVTGILGG